MMASCRCRVTYNDPSMEFVQHRARGSNEALLVWFCFLLFGYIRESEDPEHMRSKRGVLDLSAVMYQGVSSAQEQA